MGDSNFVMNNESHLKKLSAETRTKLRSAQILTSLPTIISELLQNAIDAGASQIDIGVDCAEWSCWVMDNGSGFTKDGLHKLGQDAERGRYNSSKAYNPASLETVSTFGFRGEALASMADLSCLEISSRTATSRESWSVIVKAGKPLYIGPSVRWRRESPGTVVSIRDAFFNLPVRRQSHPVPNKAIELIRQELESYALVFTNISFSFQDVSKTKACHNPHKSHILKIPRTRSTLAAFQHFYGRVFTEESIFLFSCVEEIAATSGQLQIQGFISLVGAYTKSYQFLYINRHPISFCDLHRLIDSRFAASTFAKHAYDEGGETTLRPPARRPPRKGEKKPVYVLNLVIPVKHIDSCLEPSKLAVELDNKSIVTSFLSATIQSFLVNHQFALDKRRNEDAGNGTPKKKQKLAQEGLVNPRMPLGLVQSKRAETPIVTVHTGKHVADTQKMVWKDPLTRETFIIDNRTGNSYSQSAHFSVGTGPAEASSKRRTLRISQLISDEAHHVENDSGEDHIPNWLREALQANEGFRLKDPKIPSLPLVANQDIDQRNFPLYYSGHMSCLAPRATSGRFPQLDALDLATIQTRFRKNDLRKARVISQVDYKFIACALGMDHDDLLNVERDDEMGKGDISTGGKTLVLIDQHAADERVRVERYLKAICRGFLSHQEGGRGVETMPLNPPVPVLLTRREASRLVELSDYQKAFESWGFQFSELEKSQPTENEIELEDGYTQAFVCAVPEIVSEKLLLGREIEELVKGYLGALESGELEPRDASSQHDAANVDEETQWLKALRWCPRGLLDLINSKACRGAIMFNDCLTIEQCERLVKQLSATVFPFQCAHGRPSLIPLVHLTPDSRGPRGTELEWENVGAL